MKRKQRIGHTPLFTLNLFKYYAFSIFKCHFLYYYIIVSKKPTQTYPMRARNKRTYAYCFLSEMNIILHQNNKSF
jgi:hypothetical protein